MPSHHWRVPMSTASVATTGMYRRLCQTNTTKQAAQLLCDSIQSSLTLLTSLPVRQQGLLTALDHIQNHAAEQRHHASHATLGQELHTWTSLSHALQEQTTAFTSNLVLQQYSPSVVHTKHKNAVREILFHAHSSYLAVETLMSLPAFQTNMDDNVAAIPLEHALHEIIGASKAFSVEKYGVSPPLTLNVVRVNSDINTAKDYTRLTIPKLRGLLGLSEQSSTAKSAKGTDREYFKKDALVKKATTELTSALDQGCWVDRQEIYYIEYCLVELLKNSYGTMIEKYGALDVEEAAPIQLTMNVDAVKGWTGLTLIDSGMGMNEIQMRHSFEPLYTLAQDQQDDSWRYSRNFGARFAGAGLGLFKTQVYLDFLGATNVEITTEERCGTEIAVKF